MSDYDGMDYEELLGEAEWMSDFLSMMAERITNDPDVHNLVDYVREIEDENAQLKRKLRILKEHGVEIADAASGGYEIYSNDHALADKLQAENAKLRELVRKLYACQKHADCTDCPYEDDPSCYFEDELRELGIEVS